MKQVRRFLFAVICILASLVPVICFAPDAVGAPVVESWNINCGATSDYTDPSSNLWMKDENFFSLWRWGYIGDGTNLISTTETISGTDLQAVYQVSRRGNMSYSVDVPNGTYKVTLMFAETNFNEAGKRVFDIALEGNTLWSYVDIFSWSGGKNRAMELSANVSVTDACLNITFPAIHNDYPAICGIKVEAIDVSDDAFLDFIEKKMFWFFWNNVNSTTGLVKWGENNWDTGYSNVSSIASDGFALSIYTIGAERGWVSRDEAYQRVNKMLSSFESLLTNVHGFWYHLVCMDTGAVAGDCEISTVDSALFILGAMQAGEYFRSDHPDVAARVEQLYRNMDWTWFMGIGDSFQRGFVNMGWKIQNDGYSYTLPSGKPEGGFYCNDWWNRYCESIFVDFLAMASPTHPIPSSAWNNMTRGWAEAFGYRFINEPPLFVHQYHHLYYNLTDKADNYTDYFLNTQKATLANRQTCVEDSRYELKRWGLTGCGGPPVGGYQPYGGYPGGGHDGTVAPAAAATSLIFTKDESMEAIRYMFFKYKHIIWGLHGFCDSFNIQENYRNQTACGLNNGAMMIGIENYRTGLIMNTFMNNPHVSNAFTAAGLSQAPQVAESSYESDSLKGEYAFDGNRSTRWSSLWYDTPQWLEKDFRTPITFNKITIDWETSYAKAYKIQVSNNRINWTDVYSTNSGHGGLEEIVFQGTTARYLRIYCTQRAAQWGYSIWDVAVGDAPGYWVLNMDQMDWYENIAPYNSTAAAGCQMILNYIRKGAGEPLLDQGQIYRYAKGAQPCDGSELTPDQADMALGHFDPYDYLVSNKDDRYDSMAGGNAYQGYNYSVDTRNPGTDAEAMNNYMRDICHWMAYTVTKGYWKDNGELTARPNTPALVPIYGNYDHWVVVKGCVTDQNPSPTPHTDPWNTPDFTVYGFWMKDPLMSGIGRDVYVTASECSSSYFLPMDTGDKYDGLLLQVAEPPKKESKARAEIAPPVCDRENLEFAGAADCESTLRAGGGLSAIALEESVSAAQRFMPRKRSWRDLVDKNLLSDAQAVSAFEGTRMGKPLFVKRPDKDDADYYLVPFYKKVKPALLASAVIVLDAREGYFKEASWTKNPQKILKVGRASAISMVSKKILKSGNRRIFKNIKEAEAQLVWQPNSYSTTPYEPFWKITVGGDVWYVTQKGKIFQE